MSIQAVQEQFGANARFYVTHETHARGASLTRLLEVVPWAPNWQVLDVATGTGHTALAVAPYVAHVVATDITPEMLDLTREQAQVREITNITVEEAHAEELDYPAAHFHGVTCRIAPHHFTDIQAFVARSYQILMPGGWLVIIDNIVPPGLPGAYVNALEKLRDPSHGECLSHEAWQDCLTVQGYQVAHQEILPKRMNFSKWASRHGKTMQHYLLALLQSAQGGANGYLQPRWEDGEWTFSLQEGVYVARKP